MSIESLLALRASSINLNAGPSPLPLASLLTASSSLLSNPTTPGLGLAEISHRSPQFTQILKSANSDLKRLLSIPDNYKILWMQGGGLTQFAATVLNVEAAYRVKNQLKMGEEVVGEYCVTGSWSEKALEEGKRMGVAAKVIVDGKKDTGKYGAIPAVADWDLTAHAGEGEGRKPAFVYYCDNETVDGVEFGEGAFPFSKIDKDVPVICDMSSNFLSRPVDVSQYGVIYAGAQKNLGPAGVSVVIVREDLIVDTDKAVPFGGARVPSMLSYKNMADSDSMYNTPPTFTIYVCSLVLASLLATPPVPLLTPTSDPLAPLSQFATLKSSLVYSALDTSDGFYQGTVRDPKSRSRMNITFRLKGGDKDLESKFVKEAEAEGIFGVAGHRSVGGIRTSLYNAVTLEQTKILVEFMDKFRLKYL